MFFFIEMIFLFEKISINLNLILNIDEKFLIFSINSLLKSLLYNSYITIQYNNYVQYIIILQ